MIYMSAVWIKKSLSRRLYNSNVTIFNTALDIFPSSIVANKQKLQKHEFFVAEAAKREDINMSF